MSLPIGGVASVWRPASWAGPNPSRNPVNCLSDANFTPGNIKLWKKTTFHGGTVGRWDSGTVGRWDGGGAYAPGLGSSASGSRLGCRVKRALNSTAKPVSTLLCTGSLTAFFFFSSSVDTHTHTEPA